MKSVLVLVSVLALSHTAFAASCAVLQNYTSSLQPTCNGRDMSVLWPNYKDFSSYYRCQGAGNPVLVNCPKNTFFSYYVQFCDECANCLPAPPCEQLKTVNKPVCVSNIITEAPTTIAPTTIGPSTTKGTTSTRGPISTRAPPSSRAPPTTKAPVTLPVPAPPSPYTSVPGIPTPPTPAPTPPSIDVTPPSQV